MLYIVATPIGNLKEITYRAVEVLKAVDCVFAENPLHSLKLLNEYNIKKPVYKYERFTEKEGTEKIIKRLKRGESIALISDAGMPLISDPGRVLVERVIKEGLEYTVISGATAFVNALVLSGFNTEKFVFLGFLPEKKKDVEQVLKEFAFSDTTLVLYIAPHDFFKQREMILNILGDRKAVLVREVSKKFEEIILFTLGESLLKEARGELVLVIEGCEKKKKQISNDEILKVLNRLVDAGKTIKDAIKETSEILLMPKNMVYRTYLHSNKEIKG